jgi:hypothetical protein
MLDVASCQPALLYHCTPLVSKAISTTYLCSYVELRFYYFLKITINEPFTLPSTFFFLNMGILRLVIK